MTDKELLELAAKAAGYEEVWYLEGSDTPYVGPRYVVAGPIQYRIFNPLTDDGDALRLAVKLNLFDGLERAASNLAAEFNFDVGPCETTRRAIVRAAAEIGRSMG